MGYQPVFLSNYTIRTDDLPKRDNSPIFEIQPIVHIKIPIQNNPFPEDNRTDRMLRNVPIKAPLLSNTKPNISIGL